MKLHKTKSQKKRHTVTITKSPTLLAKYLYFYVNLTEENQKHKKREFVCLTSIVWVTYIHQSWWQWVGILHTDNAIWGMVPDWFSMDYWIQTHSDLQEGGHKYANQKSYSHEECPLGKLFLPSLMVSKSPVHLRSVVITPSGKQREKKSGRGLRYEENNEKCQAFVIHELTMNFTQHSKHPELHRKKRESWIEYEHNSYFQTIWCWFNL